MQRMNSTQIAKSEARASHGQKLRSLGGNTAGSVGSAQPLRGPGQTMGKDVPSPTIDCHISGAHVQFGYEHAREELRTRELQFPLRKPLCVSGYVPTESPSPAGIRTKARRTQSPRVTPHVSGRDSSTS